MEGYPEYPEWYSDEVVAELEEHRLAMSARIEDSRRRTAGAYAGMLIVTLRSVARVDLPFAPPEARAADVLFTWREGVEDWAQQAAVEMAGLELRMSGDAEDFEVLRLLEQALETENGRGQEF